MRSNVAKLYGNVPIHRIVLQTSIGTSNHQGSHATGLVMLIFGLDEDSETHMPLPKPPEDMCFALNRMCHDSIQVKAFAYSPSEVFHPKDFASVSYLYRVSSGKLHDPIQVNHVWHVSSRSSQQLSLQNMQTVSGTIKDECPYIQNVWCEQVEDEWNNGTDSYRIHIDLQDRDANVLDVVQAIVGQPFAPTHGLVLTDVQYDTRIEWKSASRYVVAAFAHLFASLGFSHISTWMMGHSSWMLERRFRMIHFASGLHIPSHDRLFLSDNSRSSLQLMVSDMIPSGGSHPFSFSFDGTLPFFTNGFFMRMQHRGYEVLANAVEGFLVSRIEHSFCAVPSPRLACSAAIVSTCATIISLQFLEQACLLTVDLVIGERNELSLCKRVDDCQRKYSYTTFWDCGFLNILPPMNQPD